MAHKANTCVQELEVMNISKIMAMNQFPFAVSSKHIKIETGLYD